MNVRNQAFFSLQNDQKCRVLGFLGEICENSATQTTPVPGKNMGNSEAKTTG
jgi:hypothetical protein